MKNIRVSEMFYSIQGEGPTVGVPSVFLRLQGCNLNCGSKSGSWVCDTVDVWKKGTRYDIDAFFEQFYREYSSILEKGAHLIITGGEPLLQQQSLVPFIQKFAQKPFIEIETNGTIQPISSLAPLIDQWNVSPKLKNSGELAKYRIIKPSLDWFSKSNNALFKFVVSNMSDIDEINSVFPWVQTLNIRQKYLMPAADSQLKLDHAYLDVIEYAKTYGFSLSQRFHISLWNQTTGV